MTSGTSSQRAPTSGVGATSPAVAGETPAERIARIAGVLWSAPVAADVEPWTTPGRVTATVAQGNGRGQ